MATAPGGRARLPGAYGEARTGAYGEAGGVAGPLGAQSSGPEGLAEASVNAGGSSGLVSSTVEESGEGSGSQALMPSLRDWAMPCGARDDAGGSGGAAAQEGVTLAPSGGAGNLGEGGWPAGYFPAESEVGWADAGGAEDEEEEEDMADGAAGFVEPGDAGGSRMATSFDRVGGEEDDEACGGDAAHAAGPTGPPGDARGPAGGPLRDRGALARWQCHVCTFAGNRAEVLRCALCDTLKGSRAWQPPRAPQAGTLPEALPGSLAATLDLLGRSSAQAPGSGDAPRCGGAVAEGSAGFPGLGARASDAPASDAAAGAAPAAIGAEEAELPLSDAAGTAAQGADGAAGSQAAEPGWQPADGAAGGGWRCRRCGEVVGCGVGSGEGSGLESGSVAAQARGAHDDWHFALEMQRRESGPGHEPGRRGLGPGVSGAGERCGGGAGRGVEAGGRGAGGRKRKAGGNTNPVRVRSRLSRGTMDAFLLRAHTKGS